MADSIVIDSMGSSSSTGILDEALMGSTGKAGSVEVSATGALSVLNGGKISSSTFSSGDAGAVKVNSGTIVIDSRANSYATGIFGRAETGSSGRAGSVDVTATGTLSVINGGRVSSSTYSSGNAGSVKVNAGTILIDRQSSSFSTGIFDEAQSGSSGKAGSVDVTTAGTLSVLNGGVISSSTLSSGDAGSVMARAATLLVDGTASSISAIATLASSGQTGSVSVNATDSITLSNSGELSIRNDASVVNPGQLNPTVLSVTAPKIILNDAQITAASSGNVAASSIQVTASERLALDSVSITTSANLGNGGAIAIQGGKVMTLNNAQITTSVAGLTGNGGNITLGADTLFMNTGFIQANTAARDATGGKVGINVQMLVPSGSSLFVGGQTPYSFQPGVFGFNVIQAAAPTGVSGTVQMATPALDISGSLGGLNTQVISTGGLGRSPCQIRGGSSLAQTGRGGLPPSANGLLRSEPDFLLTKTSSSSFAQEDQLLALTHWGCN
jgi:large exoprotein involved in heme utilization and adhesion